MGPHDLVARMEPDELRSVVDSWADPSERRSKHLELSVAAAFHRRRRNLPPLREGEPVPGCDCPDCTGVAADAPVRLAPLVARARRAAARQPLDVEAARLVPILDIARRLGLEPVKPYPRAREWVVRCPFHNDSRPSLRLNPAKNRWYCDPCNRGGDGIRLLQETRGITFPDAVRELAA